jgi:hypothetical protein
MTTASRHSLLPAIAFLACLASSLSAQAAPRAAELRLGRATELPEVEFSRISGIRELADGRVVVADALEKRLSLVDFRKGTSSPLGRVGSGPGEYRSLGQMFAVGGDTTYVVDAMGGRWLVMKGPAFAGVITANDPPIHNSSMSPMGIDHAGHAIVTKTARDLNQERGNLTMTAADSSWLVVADLRRGVADTIAKTSVRPTRIAIAGDKEIKSISIRSNPLAAGELAALFADGTIAVARLDPYLVEWVSPAGVKTTGRPLPFQAIAVDAAEKLAAVRRMPRNDGAEIPDPETIPDWPATVPPFLAGALLAAPDGRLWIRRTPSTKAPGTDYDIIDRTGALAARLHLAANETVAGFGPSHVYVVATDDDGLQHLRRHDM